MIRSSQGKISMKRRVPTVKEMVLLALGLVGLLALSVGQGVRGDDKPPTSYMPVVPLEPFDTAKQRMSAARPEVMQR
jgi:hypothetical protein